MGAVHSKANQKIFASSSGRRKIQRFSDKQIGVVSLAVQPIQICPSFFFVLIAVFEKQASVEPFKKTWTNLNELFGRKISHHRTIDVLCASTSGVRAWVLCRGLRR